MNKMLLGLGFVIVLALFAVFYTVRDFLAPAFTLWVLIILGSFVVVFGFIAAIKLLSEL
jgi:heme/copper-type cytochrome/quinol oxidase subunit 4